MNKKKRFLPLNSIESVFKALKLSDVFYEQFLMERVLERKFNEQEIRSKKYIERINKIHGLSIDYERDVDPALAKIVRKKTINPVKVDIYLMCEKYVHKKYLSKKEDK